MEVFKNLAEVKDKPFFISHLKGIHINTWIPKIGKNDCAY